MDKDTMSAPYGLTSKVLSALVFFLGLGFGAPTLTTDFAKIQQFLGGTSDKPVKSTAVFSRGSDYFYVHFHQNPLVIKKISSDGKNAYRSLNISPDGRFVAFSTDAGKTLIRPVEENTPRSIAVGDGIFPTWWVHPKTGKLYVQYQAGKNSYDMKIREIDPIGFTAGPEKLLTKSLSLTKPGQAASSSYALNAGRSADGRFMTGDDAVHGIVELKDPLAVEGVEPLHWIYYTSLKDYFVDASVRPYNAWCNANVSPSKTSQSGFYGCVQHMGSGHSDIYIRTWPKDLTKLPAVDPTSNKCQEYQGTVKPLCDADDVIAHLKPRDGNKFYAGSFWSTHERYITAKEGAANRDATWYGYIYDVSERNDKKYARFLSKSLDRGNDNIHLWVEEGVQSTAMNAQGAGSMLFGPSRPLHYNAGSREIRVSAPGSFSLHVVDLQGRVLAERNGMGPSSITIDALPGGLHAVRLKSSLGIREGLFYFAD